MNLDSILIDGIAFTLPLFIIAVGGIFSERSGVTMLSLEGFQGFGAFMGAISVVIARLYLGSDSPWLIYIAMAASLLGGALLALVNALMVIKLKAMQTIAGVVINIIAVALTAFLSSVVTGAVEGQATNKIQLGVSPRFDVPLLSKIPVLGGLFKQMYPFAVAIIILAFIGSFVLYKTRYGLRLRAGGDNPHSLDAAGINVNHVRFTAVLWSGVFAGMGGIAFAYTMATFSPSSYMGYGFLAIAAMIFGNWNIGTTFLASAFFGFAKSLGQQLILSLNLASNYSDLFQVVPYILTIVILIFFSKHNRAPRAVGENFDKEKR